MQHLSLAWRALAEKNFVKSANAVAKLDLAQENSSSRALGKATEDDVGHVALCDGAQTLDAFEGRSRGVVHAAITVMELLDEEEGMRSYLQRCESDRSHFWYSRHLQMVELHVHLLYPKLWESLEDEVRLFLQEVRHAAQDSSVDAASDDEGDEGVAVDVSGILASLGIGHQNKIAAGPMLLDIHLHDMCIVEAAAAWSFYLRSSHLTALARRRQEMLKAAQGTQGPRADLGYVRNAKLADLK
eukprot:Skav223533  [mRNA]  locus=scaffold1160:438748:442095:+ [translate_table: standard]